LLWLFTANLRAEYVVVLNQGGLSSVSAKRGEVVELDLSLLTSAADRHNSAVLRLQFSAPGLIYKGYEWQTPYRNGDDHDDSKPLRSGLPVLLEAASASEPDGGIEVELSNVVPLGGLETRFASGTFVKLTLEIPADYNGPETVKIGVEPDVFADGFRAVRTTAGPVFNLKIAPSPSPNPNPNPNPVPQPTNDDDGDGLSNLVEYALGLDPSVSGRPIMTRTTPGLPAFAVRTVSGEPQLEFEFWKFPAKGDIRYRVQTSTNLRDWVDEEDHLVTTAPGDAEIRRVTLALSGAGRFVRLRIERVPE
jgi:hypothetical protein